MVRDAFNVVVPEGCSWCALWPRRACRMQNTQRVETETSRARESLLFRFSRAVRSRFHRTNMLRRPPATRSFDHGQHRPTGPGYIPATMHSGASNCRAGVQCIYSKPRAFFSKNWDLDGALREGRRTNGGLLCVRHTDSLRFATRMVGFGKFENAVDHPRRLAIKRCVAQPHVLIPALVY